MNLRSAVVLDPAGEVERVHQALDLPSPSGDPTRAGVRPPPGEEPWLAVPPGEIEHVMPHIGPTHERTGYGWHPAGDEPRSTDDAEGPH